MEMDFPYDLDPHARDGDALATSLLHNAETVLGCLDAVHARSITEVGAFMGELTRLLLHWADESGATVTAIDVTPPADLAELGPAHDNLQIVAELSLDALEHTPLTDVFILDSDHNYYTLSHELEVISRRVAAEEHPFPLLLLHDVRWPHGRRDDYYVPDRIPAEHRQPLATAGLHPDEPGTRYGGLPCDNPAAREGGARNGVMTAIEDFMADRPGLRLVTVPAFFGLGVMWDTTGPHDAALTELLEPLDGHPLLERLERNRVLHIANSHVNKVLAHDARAEAQQQIERSEQQRALLRRMLQSRVFWAAELFLRAIHRRDEPAFSRAQIRRLLDGPPGS